MGRALASGLLFMCLASSSAPAEEETLTESHKQFITDSVNLLGDCSGYFEFMSGVFKSDGKPATGQQIHEMANGAMLAASYLLYLEYHATAGNKPRALGTFSHYPQSRADTNKTRVAALFEQQDTESIQAEQKRCIDAVPLQKDLVQKMRNDSVGRQ